MLICSRKPEIVSAIELGSNCILAALDKYTRNSGSVRGRWRDSVPAHGRTPILRFHSEVIAVKVIQIGTNRSQIELGLEEILILNNSLNEVCNGIDLFEFATRMGVDRERVRLLLAESSELFELMESLEP